MAKIRESQKVDRCDNCPFYSYHWYEPHSCYGPSYGECGLDDGPSELMYADEVPHHCPLRKGPVIVELDHEILKD